MANRGTWIRIYKELRRTANQFPQYNYREFAGRRIRDYFEANKGNTNQDQLRVLHIEALENLDKLKRQVAVSKQYPYRPLVIEKPKPASL
ncbi:unnamed protein product [Bursaphelenchus xylophilus]|uniref:(pine wood nematode) hypothetical protein n=1 Tax=Bursaphelenchus xylophilus TaxID=6326 RepID=A0A1I7RPY3_BURXY|nr:unnamed protein product [Bursaphelenchus xylophilus]CAG9096820.1 unnamed protein product [Bursaphelenchus xylophilus]